MVISPASDLYAVPKQRTDDRRTELRAFQATPLPACVRTSRSVAANLRGELSPEDLALFDVYLGILDDSAIGGEVAGLIKAGAVGPGRAEPGDDRAHPPLRAMDHSYLQGARGRREGPGHARAVLSAGSEQERGRYPEQAILVGEELTASSLGEIPTGASRWPDSVRGSGNSHVAILARAMGVPTVMGAVDLPYAPAARVSLVIDGYNGNVHLNPGRGSAGPFPGGAGCRTRSSPRTWSRCATSPA